MATDDFLRALRRGAPATALETLRLHNPPAVMPARRRATKKKQPPRRRHAQPPPPPPPPASVPPEMELRLARLEKEVAKQNKMHETHRRRLDATAETIGHSARRLTEQEAKVATLEKAKAKTDVSGAASARALSARLRAVEQRVAEQSEHAQHAEEQSTRLHGALARLATMQRKQEQLGREQQMLASRLQSLPSELSELAEPSIRPSSAPVERRSAPPPRQQPPPRQPPPPPRQSPRVPPRAAACAPAAPTAPMTRDLGYDGCAAFLARHPPVCKKPAAMPQKQTLCEQVGDFYTTLRPQPKPSLSSRRGAASSSRPRSAPSSSRAAAPVSYDPDVVARAVSYAAGYEPLAPAMAPASERLAREEDEPPPSEGLVDRYRRAFTARSPSGRTAVVDL